MSGPQHLWSGDWELESSARRDELAAGRNGARPPAEPEPEPERLAPPPRRPRRPTLLHRLRTALVARRRGLRVVGLVAVLILLGAGAAYAVTSALGGSSSTNSPVAASGSQAWLGIDVSTSASGGVMVTNVIPGSPAYWAGMEAGDVIIQVNGKPVYKPADVISARRRQAPRRPDPDPVPGERDGVHEARRAGVPARRLPMSFLHPAVLIALLAIPLLIWWYVGQQRRRGKAASAFVVPALSASVAPSRPRWRRHVPMLAFALALAVLIVAAARPQRTLAVPINTASIMLANDTSGSMAATDVSPSRLAAAEKAASDFLAKVPSSVRVGLLQFNTTVSLLQSPTTDHDAVRSALAQLRVTGGTAIGDAHPDRAAHAPERPATGRQATARRHPADFRRRLRRRLRSDHRRAAGGGRAHSDLHGRARDAERNGQGEARQPDGDGAACRRTRHSSRRSPASRAGRRSPPPTRRGSTRFTSDSAPSSGTRRSSTRITASFAGGGLVLLLLGSVLSLAWFGRLI